MRGGDIGGGVAAWMLWQLLALDTSPPVTSGVCTRLPARLRTYTSFPPVIKSARQVCAQSAGCIQSHSPLVASASLQVTIANVTTPKQFLPTHPFRNTSPSTASLFNSPFILLSASSETHSLTPRSQAHFHHPPTNIPPLAVPFAPVLFSPCPAVGLDPPRCGARSHAPPAVVDAPQLTFAIRALRRPSFCSYYI